MTDRRTVLGIELPAFTITPERGQLQFFASVIGETDPVYHRVDAARAAGLPDLPVPPTFLFSLELKRPEPYRVLSAIGADLSQALHGEQTFVFHRQSFAGEELAFAPRVTDYYEKKGGAMKFIVRSTDVTTTDGEAVAELVNTLILLSGEST